MSFDGRRGTRGGWQPRGRVLGWVNRQMARRVRRRGGKMMGFNILVLTTVGRRSGQQRVNPVGWFPGPDGSWLIVASANGAVDNPAWYYNMAAHPDRVSIEVDGRTVAVRAEQLRGPALQAAWAQITAAAPRFARYRAKTDREIPVVRLVERIEH